MSGSSSSGMQDSPTRAVVGRGISAVREVVDQLRSPTGSTGRDRPGRTDVREDVLVVLAERPASGYEIVRVLGERGGDDPAPTAGAVYPTLQLLADEGLATAEETAGRRIWTLTAAGAAAADEARAASRRPGSVAARAPEHRGGIARAGAQLGQAVALAAQTASPPQRAQVIAVLDDARRAVLAILARS